MHHAGIPADLLRDLDASERVKLCDIQELHRAADPSLRITKKMARAIGLSMAALVATERHLWLNLSGIREKDKAFLLDVPLSLSGLFSNTVNSDIDRFQVVKKQAAALMQYLPRHSRSREAVPSHRQAPHTDNSKRRVLLSEPRRKDLEALSSTLARSLQKTDLWTILLAKKAPEKWS